MNFTQHDLLNLRWGLLAFILSLILGGGAMWLSSEYVSSSLKDRQSAQKQVVEARSKLSATQSDLENMSTYALEYTALLNNKIVGGENRLDWIEGLEKIRQQHRVLDFKYTISPQQPYAPNPALDTGSFEIKQSNVNLQLDLLHEGQLIDFFELLRNDIKGWFIIDHCSLARTGANGNMTDATSNIKADCTGSWITMKNRNAP